MPSKYFPIRTATACQLKWNWSTLYLTNGRTASCHRTTIVPLSLENFDDFHNLAPKKADRLLMLEGQWPASSCAYCKDLEESGKFSDRMLHLNVPDMSPPELEDDDRALEISPTILEVYFNNICNLACLYCIPELSSKINQENAKFGTWSYKDMTLETLSPDPNQEQMLAKFWSWMERNSHKLRRFNVLGGEPFYQDDYYKLLDYFETTSHPDLELGIVTNLMLGEDKLQDQILRWQRLLSKRHLKRVDLTASIDCWGVEQEYVRHGLDLARWQSNFESLLEHNWLRVNINQTISVLTIKTMPDLLKRLEHWRTKRRIGHFFSETDPQPSYMKPNILGSGIFEKDFENILALMPDHTDQDKMARSYMRSIGLHAAKSQRNDHEVDKLNHYLTEKDRRRNTDWRETFPWLVKEIEKCGIAA